jgi:ribose transport system substrate-binding protein
MQIKTSNVVFGSLLFLSLFLFMGCGDSEEDTSDDGDGSTDPGDDSDNQEAWLERLETPEGDFVPEDIEGVLDDIADAINKTEQQPDMKLAVIPKTMTGYFLTAVLGANRAIGELGVIGSVTASEKGADTQASAEAQVAVAQPIIDDGYTGMTIAPYSSYLLDFINGAVDDGAVILTFDSDVADSDRHYYLGTDNAGAGKTAGETLTGLLGDAVGTVIILGQDTTDWLSGYDRTMAAKEVLEAAGNTVVVLKTDWTTQDNNLTNVSAAIQAADPAVVGLLGMFSNAYYCAQAAEAEGIIDDVKIAAFDFEALTLEYMQSGKIQATHAQRQYYMGYLAPYIHVCL